MNNFGRIRKALNNLKSNFEKNLEEKRDLARFQVLMNAVNELIKKAQARFPDIPPKDTPYGVEIQKLMNEADGLLNKKRDLDGSKVSR
jgi:hypothetical protein